MKRCYKLFILMALLLGKAMANEDVVISIDEGFSAPIPIAITEFEEQSFISQENQGKSVTSFDLAQIVDDDLRASGKFATFSRNQMPKLEKQDPEQFRAWADLGLDYVVVGYITHNEITSRVSFQLIDTLGIKGDEGSAILNKTYEFNRDDYRRIAHKISNDIFEFLTNQKGNFNTKVAYVFKNRQGIYHLRTSDFDGSNVENLIHSSNPILSPRFSNDGKHIVYVTLEKDRSSIRLLNINTKREQVIVSYKGYNGSPFFTANNTVIFTSNRDGKFNIYVKDRNYKMAKLTHKANNTEAVISKDGKYLLFVSDRSGNPLIYVKDIKTGNTQALTQETSFSPQIANNSKFMVAVVNNKVVRVDFANNKYTNISRKDGQNPSISPNGTMILFSEPSGINTVIRGVSADGKTVFSFINRENGQYMYPTFAPY